MDEQLVVLVDPWQDKYDRLMEANEKLQKLNQTLEDKLLKLAEKNHAETSGLSEQIQDLTQRLVDARLYIHQLADENDRYRNDINVVIQLLQCKPSNFISPKIETLPEDLQRKILGIKNGVGSGGTRKEKKIIKVQVPTFPPTDIMYAVDKGKGKKTGDNKDIVSAAIMAKVLQERENERKENRRNNCHCRYRVALPTMDQCSQTMPSCTISYSEFEFYNSEPDEEEDEDDEEDAESIVNHHSDNDNRDPVRSHNVRSMSPGGGRANIGRHSTPQFQLSQPRRPSSWAMSGAGRPPGGAVPVRTTLTTTFDEIIKTSREEEARLPTPLFDGHLRHRNQSSASSVSIRNQHNHSHSNDNQDQSLSSLTSSLATNAEQFNNHLAHHHSNNHHHHSHAGNGHDHHSTTLFMNNASDTNSMTTATSNGNVSSSCRDTPPSLQRSSSSSLSSPSSGLPPLSIPTSASITTDLNGDIMMSMSSSSCSGNTASSSNSSHVMSSACNTPSSCSNASTSGIGGGGHTGIFHEPLPMSSCNSSSNNHGSNMRPMPTGNYVGGGNISISNSSINSSNSSFSSNNNSNTPNNIITLRKGARLSTSHISNVCANGSVTSSSLTTTSSAAAASGSGGMYDMTRSSSWSRDKMDQGVGNSTPSTGNACGAAGGLGLMTNLGNHWRSTVLVHNPPRSHSSYEPLSVVSVQGDGIGGQQTTFSASLSPKSVAVPSANSNNSPSNAVDSSAAHNDYSVECNSDSEQPLLQHHQHHPQYSQPPAYMFHAYHNPQTATSGSNNGGFFGNVSTTIASVTSNNLGYTNINSNSGNTTTNSNQYYRAQKRTFWARSSSTTSTETEI